MLILQHGALPWHASRSFRYRTILAYRLSAVAVMSNCQLKQVTYTGLAQTVEYYLCVWVFS